EALRASEERYRALFDFDPVAIYSCDVSGVIQQFNRRAAELWGREPASGDTDERFCGSVQLFRADGTLPPRRATGARGASVRGYRRAVLRLVQVVPSRRQLHAPRAVSHGRGDRWQNTGRARRGSAHRAPRWLTGDRGGEYPSTE